MKRNLVLLAALSMPLPLCAQLPPGSGTAIPAENVIPWPTNLGAGPVRKLVGALLNDVNHRAAVGLRGPVAATAVAPAITPYITGMDLGASVIDCVTLPGAGLGPPGGQHRDALLCSVIADDELRFVWTNAGGELQKTPVSHPTWDRASMLNAFADATGITVAGRSLAGTSVVVTHFDRTTTTFTELPPIPVGALIRDLCVFDANDDGVPDVAVMTDTQVQFHSLLGGTPSTRSLAHPGGAVEPLPEPGRRGGLALLQRNAANDGWELIRLLDGVADAAVAVAIDGVANFTLTAMTSGDTTGDGLSDVALQNAGNSVLLVKNDPSATPRFANASSGPLLTVGDPGDVQQAASVCDYDYDGNPDVLVPGTTATGVPFLWLATGTRSRFAPEQNLPGNILAVCEHGGVLGSNTFRLCLTLDDYLAGFDGVTVTYYSAVEGPGLGTTYFAEKVDSGEYPMDLGQGNQLTADIELDVDWIDRPAVLFLTVQFHKTDNYTEKPIFLAGGTIDNLMVTQATSAYLAANQVPQTEPRNIERVQGGRQQIGLIFPQRSLPAHID